MHPAIWDACLDSFDKDCSHYRDIIQRDRDCELCDQKVHTADRHMRNCVVLFQVAVASAWHRAGAPEHSENSQINPSLFTAQIVKKLLEEPTLPAPQEDKPLLTFLERNCALCSHPVVNQQDWRRHMKRATTWSGYQPRPISLAPRRNRAFKALQVLSSCLYEDPTAPHY